ncbi:PREDICTED: putative nuclease HARBI1 [Cyphomyrmex costatus]|uniref:putative nuclease HARBI1 n=1 Tax=Cyphomyrmex costatus TaxID=456900 RepID=UPI0008521D7C|nr:PREDICTED: putative nuclease HARBI1 [Cyphomyrmex costatus]
MAAFSRSQRFRSALCCAANSLHFLMNALFVLNNLWIMEAIILIAIDDDLNINDIINNIAEDLGQPQLFDDLEVRRNERPRNENYYELIIPRYTDIQFIEHFRMSRCTFEELLHVTAPLINDHEFANVNVEKKVMFTIWVLAKSESFLAVGDRFNLAKSTGHAIFKNVISAWTQLMPQYVQWPNAIQQQISCNVFQNRSHGFPGVIGAIDECHIPCKQPPRNTHDYYNRKGFHSIILQAACDHKGVFIDCHIGMPGRMHDARVFRNSPLYNQIRNAEMPLIPNDMHLIGDSAYPLMQNVMVPFRDNGHLLPSQITYNVKLSSIRSIIEMAYGRLKTKFRRLKYLDIADFNLGNEMIAAACVLHNFIIIGDRLNIADEDYIYGGEMDLQENNIMHEYNEQEAVQKRNFIVDRF